jgi:hypothetical protein
MLHALFYIRIKLTKGIPEHNKSHHESVFTALQIDLPDRQKKIGLVQHTKRAIATLGIRCVFGELPCTSDNQTS